MKLYNFILLFITNGALLLCTKIEAQQPLNQINVVSFVVKNKLPADVASWASIPASIILVAQKLPTAQLQSIKLIVQIKQANTKVCGYAAQATTAIDAFAIRNFTANELTAMLANCPKLSNNMYSICVQFYNVDNYPISREFCKEFVVGDVATMYSTPQNIAPANDKIFADINVKAPIIFTWLPVVPKPKSVTYKLRIWQLMQGQTAMQAIKTNEPIVEKIVQNINKAIIPNFTYNPCSAGYLCHFVWAVQAVDKDDKPIGKNEGVSDWYSFKIK